MDARFAGVSADGLHVYFDTAERLTSTDIDNVRDVYERFGGTTSEVSVRPSGGASTVDSFFVGNTPDGSHVYFVSYDNLTADDTDSGQKDVYDRSGGTTTLISKGSIGGSGCIRGRLRRRHAGRLARLLLYRREAGVGRYRQRAGRLRAYRRGDL